MRLSAFWDARRAHLTSHILTRCSGLGYVTNKNRALIINFQLQIYGTVFMVNLSCLQNFGKTTDEWLEWWLQREFRIRPMPLPPRPHNIDRSSDQIKRKIQCSNHFFACKYADRGALFGLFVKTRLELQENLIQILKRDGHF